VFCPNCGTQNDDSAASCQKCAFNLKGAAAPKFKGTMLMVNSPAAPRPMPGAAVSSAKPPAPMMPVAAPAAPAPRPVGVPQKPVMKATMIGVAPPSPGAVAPPIPAAPPPPVAGAPTSPAFVVAPPPAAAQWPQEPAIAPPPAAPGPSPFVPESVNPLGGTMVATPGAMMGYGMSPPPAAAPAGGGQFMPQPAAPALAPMGAGTPFGATTPSGHAPNEVPGAFPAPAAGGWGAPAPAPVPAQQPQQSPYGAPQSPYGAPQSPYGAPQSPYGAPQSPYGDPSAYGAPAGMAGSPQAMQAAGGPGAGYAMQGAIGQHGPIGKTRNPVMVVVLTYVTCGIYGLIAILAMIGELKAFRQKDDLNPIMFLLPVISLLEMIKLPAKILDAKRMAGVPNAQEPNVILYLLLGIYMLPADLNEIWQVASARQGYGGLPPGSM
jgi:hypothetical protein